MSARAIRSEYGACAYSPSRRGGAGLDPASLSLARAKRAQGVGWQAIGRMVGRSEHDLRLAIDPGYAPPEGWVRPPRAGRGEASS